MVMAKKKQGRAMAFLKYALIRAGDEFFCRLPFPAARFVSDRVADVWRLIDSRHARIALAQCMDRLGLDEEAGRRLVKENYRHLALLAVEVSRLAHLPVAEVMARSDCARTAAVVAELAAEKKGYILITGHLGNWEWGSVVLGQLGNIAGFIARPFNNPYLDRYMNRIRERGGAKVWNKFGGIRNALKALRRGKGFVAVADQDGGPNGTPAPFLGKIGSTMAMPVDLAIHTGAPIVVGAVFRDKGDLRFRFETEPVIRPIPGADPRHERIRLLVEVNANLSRLVRRHPEQWLWIHRRWRTRECRYTSGRTDSGRFEAPGGEFDGVSGEFEEPEESRPL